MINIDNISELDAELVLVPDQEIENSKIGKTQKGAKSKNQI